MNNLVNLYVAQGKQDEARPLVRALREADQRRANRPGVSSRVKYAHALALLTCVPAYLRDPQTALTLARDACAMTDNANPVYLLTLALAQRLTGDTPAASETEEKALSLPPPDDPAGRREYDAALARYEAALKEADTAQEPGGG